MQRRRACARSSPMPTSRSPASASASRTAAAPACPTRWKWPKPLLQLTKSSRIRESPSSSIPRRFCSCSAPKWTTRRQSCRRASSSTIRTRPRPAAAARASPLRRRVRSWPAPNSQVRDSLPTRPEAWVDPSGPDKTSPYDLLNIGGGINGTRIARDAAGRGLKVLLLEQDDLAAHTSSASTKLIHGGLRYLETYDFRLVRESLIERERLLEAAPHLVRPLRFVLPHDPLTRPVWLVRLGLFLYDHLAPRKRLPACERLDLAKDSRGAPLKLLSPTGFAYSDCAVDDSRLVVVNAVDAAARGALIRTRTRLEQAERAEALWNCIILDRSTRSEERRVGKECRSRWSS